MYTAMYRRFESFSVRIEIEYKQNFRYNNHVINKRFIGIYGPTASGKTDLAIKISEKTNGIIVNFDSCQFRNHLHSFTMCPKVLENRDFLFNFLHPHENFSCGNFIEKFQNILQQYPQRQIILVGGTGFYLFCLLKGISKDKDNNMHNEIFHKTYEEKFQLLKILDDSTNLHINDHYRIDRHLNFLLKYGYSIKEKQTIPIIDINNISTIFLHPSKEVLQERIILRLKDNIDNMIMEAKNTEFHEKFHRIIGYKEIINYIHQNISYEDAFNEIVRRTLKYAKQQKTFFKKQIKSDFIFDYIDNNEILEKIFI